MGKWDDKYAEAPEGLFGSAPNMFLCEITGRPDFTARTGICIADGDGRNSRYLASRGIAMTAVDLSAVACENGRRLDAAAGVSVDRIAGDVTSWQPANGQHWDAAFLFYLQAPSAERMAGLALLQSCVQSGGWIVIEGFGKQRGGDELGPGQDDLLYSLDEIHAALPDVEVQESLSGLVRLNEGGRHQGLGGVVRFAGRKR